MPADSISKPATGSEAAELTFSAGTLILRGWTLAAVRKVFSPALWTWDERIHGWRTAAVNYSLVAEQLQSKSVGTRDLVSEVEAVDWGNIALPALREEQQAAVAAWHARR